MMFWNAAYRIKRRSENIIYLKTNNMHETLTPPVMHSIVKQQRGTKMKKFLMIATTCLFLVSVSGCFDSNDHGHSDNQSHGH